MVDDVEQAAENVYDEVHAYGDTRRLDEKLDALIAAAEAQYRPIVSTGERNIFIVSYRRKV